MLRTFQQPWTDIIQIDSVPAGAVVFVTTIQQTSNALYGGVMSTRAKASGAVGSVINGRFRDLQEQRELNYPVCNHPLYSLDDSDVNCLNRFLPVMLALRPLVLC